ncbi:hypothetical protein [uncultured Shewanella sp.]|nr:hypothetical protein [uncultured Shewanella sp.]
MLKKALFSLMLATTFCFTPTVMADGEDDGSVIIENCGYWGHRCHANIV